MKWRSRSSTSITPSAPSWRPRARRSSPLLLLAGCLAACLAGCFPREGAGRVDAAFTVTDCPPGEDNDDLDGYGYAPGFLGTTRYLEEVSLVLREHPTNPTESDGLQMDLDLSRLRDQGHLVLDEGTDRWRLAAPPLTLPVAFEGPDVRASLSMFQTCPDFPTVYAVSGALVFDELSIARDPEDTGHEERFVGTLTASIARGTPLTEVGTLRATFDFEAPRRPLMTFE